MTQILLLALSLIFALPAQAQFAPGYGPAEYDEAADGSAVESEEENAASALFRSPEEVNREEQAAQHREPPRIKKPVPYPGSIRILAIINGDIITTEDINHRVRAFCLNTGIPYNSETKLLILNKVMQNTIDEKLKLQDAVKNDIDINPKEIDAAIRTFEANNNIPPMGYRKILKEYGISENVFREQMKSDLVWLRLVRQKSASDYITQPEIEEAIAAAKKDAGKTKYMVSEIVIAKKDAEHISQLVDNLRHDPRFELYAAQFSVAPSSASGGRLGWINAGQLPQPLDNALQKMKAGQISNPVLYNNEYYIFRLEKKFDPAVDHMAEPSVAEVKYMLQNQKMERFAAQHLQELRQKASIELKE